MPDTQTQDHARHTQGHARLLAGKGGVVATETEPPYNGRPQFTSPKHLPVAAATPDVWILCDVDACLPPFCSRRRASNNPTSSGDCSMSLGSSNTSSLGSHSNTERRRNSGNHCKQNRWPTFGGAPLYAARWHESSGCCAS